MMSPSQHGSLIDLTNSSSRSATTAPSLEQISESLGIGKDECALLLERYRAHSFGTGRNPANIPLADNMMRSLGMASPTTGIVHLPLTARPCAPFQALPPASSSMPSLHQFMNDHQHQRESLFATQANPAAVILHLVDNVASAAARAQLAEMAAFRAQQELREATQILALHRMAASKMVNGLNNFAASSSIMPLASSFSRAGTAATAAAMACARRQCSSSLSPISLQTSSPPPLVQKKSPMYSANFSPPHVSSSDAADTVLEAARACMKNNVQKKRKKTTQDCEDDSVSAEEQAKRADLKEAVKKCLARMLPAGPPSAKKPKLENANSGKKESKETLKLQANAITAVKDRAKKTVTEFEINNLVLRVPAVKTKHLPRRPLSAYNFFFSQEREAVISELSIPPTNPNESEETTLNRKFEEAASASYCNRGESSDHVATVEKFEELLTRILKQQSQRRPHRKTHGKIGFKALAKLIGARWKNITPERRVYYNSFAKMDLARYKRDATYISRHEKEFLRNDCEK